MALNGKVFISYHKEGLFVPSEISFSPIQVGAALASTRIPDMIYDDEGENISWKNRSYCELTAQYWAWKNTDLDYYGFFHYRRFLSINELIKGPKNDFGVFSYPYLDERVLEYMGFGDPDGVSDLMELYDVVTISSADLADVGLASVRHQYERDGSKLDPNDIDIILEIVKDVYPDCYHDVLDYFEGTTFYHGNIFIMRKELFHAYSEWLFTILEEFEHRKDISLYSVEGYRTPGHLAERLFGAFYSHLVKEGNNKTHELPMVFFENAEGHEVVEPAFSGESIPIVMASSERFAPFAGITIQSIVQHAFLHNKYDIIILESGIEPKTKELLLKIVRGFDNFSIRFVDARYYVNNYRLRSSKTIGVETYFRLLIPELLKGYDKVLYLDADLIIRHDVAELYAVEIGSNLLGAVVDVCEAGNVNGRFPANRDYAVNVMRLEEPWKQFNAGVLVINVAEFTKAFTTRYLFEFVEAGAFRFMDQDALNILCQGRVHWLSQRWNFMADEKTWYRGVSESFAPQMLYREYLAAAADPFILHYAGQEKPWIYPEQEWADQFWTAAVSSPFFGRLFAEQSFRVCQQDDEQQKSDSIKEILYAAGTKVFNPNGIVWQTMRKTYHAFRRN